MEQNDKQDDDIIESPFDKFMDDILIKENHQRAPDDGKETPQRRYIKRYRERPLNRIRITGGK